MAIAFIDSHAAELKDSVDVRINRALDKIYDELYFTDYAKAAAAFDQQVDIASKAGRWHMVLSTLTLKAKCAYNHYLEDKTYSTLLQVEAIAEKYHVALDSLDPVRAYRSEINYVRGMHFHEVGDFKRSINSFQMIIDNQRKYKGLDPFYLYYVHSFLGHACLQLMLFDKAYLNYEEASAMLALSNGEKDSYQHAMINLYKGQCKEYKGKNINDPRLAQESAILYKQALRQLIPQQKKSSYKGALMSAYNRLAAVSSFSGDYDSAIYYLRKSKGFQNENEPTLSLTYSDLGEVYSKKRDYVTAREFFDNASTIADRSYVGKHFQKSIPALKKAEMLLTQNELTNALAACQYALTQLVYQFDPKNDLNILPSINAESNVGLLLDALMLKGRIHGAMFKKSKDVAQLNLSVSSFRHAIEVIQNAQKKYPDGEYKQNLAAKAQPLYEFALDAVFSAYEHNRQDTILTELIFQLIESNKSTMLRDASNNTMAFQFDGVPASILEKESFLKGSIASMRSRLYESPRDTSVAKWKRELYALTSQYDSVLRKIAKDYPRYFEFKYSSKILSIQAVRKAITTSTALVEYFWGERSVYIIAMSQSQVVIKKVQLDDELKTNVTALIQSITSSKTKAQNDARDFSKISNAIYGQILEPVLTGDLVKDIGTLVVVPDGALSYLPFDILVTSPKDQRDFRDLPYLLKRYTLRSLFSASEITVDANEKQYPQRYVGFAPGYDNAKEITLEGTNINFHAGALTNNIAEVTSAAGFFDGQVFLEKAATEEVFRTVSGNGRVLHLSMHGVMNDQEPSFSALIFSTPDSSSNTDLSKDGLLYLHELYNIPVNVELAVLSACETGSGRYARGEGIMSLGRAFRYAGCENIVMSLWRVNDNTTARLMNSFFKNLKSGFSKDQSLREAKLAFINAPENKYFSHPYFWSGFVLVGDPTPVFKSNAKSYLLLTGLVLLCSMVGLAIYFLRRRRRQIKI